MATKTAAKTTLGEMPTNNTGGSLLDTLIDELVPRLESTLEASDALDRAKKLRTISDANDLVSGTSVSKLNSIYVDPSADENYKRIIDMFYAQKFICMPNETKDLLYLSIRRVFGLSETEWPLPAKLQPKIEHGPAPADQAYASGPVDLESIDFDEDRLDEPAQTQPTKVKKSPTWTPLRIGALCMAIIVGALVINKVRNNPPVASVTYTQSDPSPQQAVTQPQPTPQQTVVDRPLVEYNATTNNPADTVAKVAGTIKGSGSYRINLTIYSDD